jgi:two-component system, OmpR family, sensor kinase
MTLPRSRGSKQRRTWTIVVRDLVLAGLVGVLMAVVLRLPWPSRLVPVDDLLPVLVSATAACAAAAAILAAIVHRLTPDPRAVWISAAFTLYGAISLPASSMRPPALEDGGPIVDAIRFSGHALVVVLLFVAASPPVPRLRSGPIRVSLAGIVVVLAAAGLAAILPNTADAITGFTPVRLAIAVAGTLAGMAMMLVGLVQGSAAVARVGIGTGVIAVAHLAKLWTTEAGSADQGGGLTIAALRLLGGAVLLLGLMPMARRAFSLVHEADRERREELQLARMGLARAAERDHELRNGLAGLAGATHLLTTQVSEAGELRAAMTAELERLEAMLTPEARARSRDVAPAYPIAPVLADMVTLRSCAGMDIRCDVDPWLWAVGSPAMLRQVLCNVLTNCARHAPGSPVRVQASQRGDLVRLRISDFGPGVSLGSEGTVFERGVRSRDTGGQGLGLHICRALLAQEGGMIHILPASSVRAGCTVIVDLPRAKTLISRGELAAVPNQS